MADIRKLAPILLKWEAGALPEKYIGPNISTPITLEQQWQVARRKGFSNDPDDAGGATMCGITIATYKRYCKTKGKPEPTVAQLKAITLTEWLDILRTFYWGKMKADDIRNQSIANLCVDNVWGSGSGYIKQIQIVAGVTPDGIVGPKTLAAINNANQRDLFNRLVEKRRIFYMNICLSKNSNKKFLKGWMNRLADFKFSEQ